MRGGASVRASQSCTAPLQVAVARYRPSRLYATLQTSESCSRVRTSRPSSPFNGVASQIWTPPSALPEARRPSWLIARQWQKGAGPCSFEEARARLRDPNHPWHKRGPLYRADIHTALNALIQGSAARHTKLWMRAVWREGIVPLLQMHDALECSVSSREQAELVARLGEEAVQLDVPMRVDLKFGRSWGDAKHKWEELA